MSITIVETNFSESNKRSKKCLGNFREGSKGREFQREKSYLVQGNQDNYKMETAFNKYKG